MQRVIFAIAPGQNRTDASSLEGYCSTIELQAQDVEIGIMLELTFFLQASILLSIILFIKLGMLSIKLDMITRCLTAQKIAVV